jgi:hypothetical protein
VQTDLLEANQVLAVSDAPRDGDGLGSLVCCRVLLLGNMIKVEGMISILRGHTVVRPGDGAGGGSRLVLKDLEPDIALAVESSRSAWGLGHVHVHGTRVIQVGVL